ncbi:RING-H2 finger protein ATL20-like isoform X2 [Lycium barbarum]|uniref:RING-H2 finger protein ATL20-like isoform X2 n=1 Tax=Lycium barbarum TaxID=112863 RepID=UPI00293F526F|nr:RING-H2 finger protein ATL20-like isoform X2 [Lycium barbarum]
MTILTLTNSLRLHVLDIDYVSQQIRVSFRRSCVVNLLHFNFSASPFLLDVEFFPRCNYSIFDCSDVPPFPRVYFDTSDSLIIAVSNIENLLDYYAPLVGCKKIDEIPSAPCAPEYSGDLYISWLNPKCGYCEDQGMDCGFKNYTKQLTIQCRPTKGGVLAIALFGIVIMALYEFYSSNKI